jgi:hypothetical protein
MNLSVATYRYKHWSLTLRGDFFVVYFMMLSVLRPYFVKWQDDWWKMNWKGFWRCSHDLITVLSWRLSGRTEENRKNLVRIVSVLAETEIEHFSNTSLVHICYTGLLSPRGEHNGGQEEVYRMEPPNLYSSHCIVSMTKSRRIWFMQNVVYMSVHKCINNFGWKTCGNPIQMQQ